jgi:ABC-2 type transport system ATP-binding protein
MYVILKFKRKTKMNMIDVQQLKKTFNTRQSKSKQRIKVEAVKGINLQIKEGEIFGFLGPNGAGKSTTLRMLTTLIPPTAGNAIVAGYDLLRQADQVRCQIGFVSQVGGSDNDATAREDLLLQAQLYGLSPTRARIRCSELIESFKLTDFADRQVKTLSGGQRRRLDLALAMVHCPRLLFLDEPTTGLDPQMRAHLWDEIRNLQAKGTTIFLTTHYLEEANALANHLAIIDYGQIVAEGTPDSLKHQIGGDVIRFELSVNSVDLSGWLQTQSFVREAEYQKNGWLLRVENGEAALPHLLNLLNERGIQVQTVSLARPSLDDIFLKKTGRSLRDSNH